MLDHDYRVGALGQHAAGAYARALARGQAEIGLLAHGHLAAKFQVGWLALAGAKGVFCPYRETVHGGAGESGQVVRCDEVFGQAAAGCKACGNRFGVQAPGVVCQGQNLGH